MACAVRRLLQRSSRSFSVTATQSGLPVVAAALLQRPPVVQPRDPEWMEQYQRLKMEKRSALSKDVPPAWNQGQRRKQEVRLAPWFTPEAVDAEFMGEKFDPHFQDLHSRLRAPARDAFLVVHSKDTGKWSLPQLALQEGSTMRETATKALTSSVGPHVQVHVLGNAPCAHIEAGDKAIFIYRSWFVSGQETQVEGSDVDDFAWLSKDELLKLQDMQWLVEGGVAEAIL